MESPSKKLEQINIRLSEESKAKIVAMSERTGYPLSELMTRGALRYGQQLLTDRARSAGRTCPR